MTIEIGALARTTDHGYHWDDNYVDGMKFVVEDYVSAEEAEDGVAFYYGSHSDGMNNVTVLEEHAELALSKSQMGQRQLPSKESLQQAFAFELLGSWDEYSISEADHSEPGVIDLLGETEDGLPFSVKVYIGEVHHVS